MGDDTPVCVGDEDHAWVSGSVEELDGGGFEIVSRQCRRCGYVDELAPEQRFRMVPSESND